MKWDTVVIGGGIIGLSIAYELSKRGKQVILLERGKIGRKASWAGAGILPPVEERDPIHPLEQLESLSSQLHRHWANELRQMTGIDNGYRECGGIYVARTNGEKAAIVGAMEDWNQKQITYEILEQAEVNRLFQGNSIGEHAIVAFVPGESQVRNPYFLQALEIACRHNGVKIIEDCCDLRIWEDDRRMIEVEVSNQRVNAETVCFACGAWTELLLNPLGQRLTSTPVRGQMALFKLDCQTFEPVINEGSRYLVPREDGHVLAGSTIDEVGFDESTEETDVENLIHWANSLSDNLSHDSFVKAWAGLRPATYDGFPFLGKLPESQNGFVATGHFKAGLHLAPATAVSIADLIEGRSPNVDLSVFSPARAKFQGSIEAT